ncbi:MAG: hypothetical protein ACYTEG_04435 [Planctomycetota bacterium]
MRALVLMIVGLAGFSYLALRPHQQAQELLSSERAAVAELRTRARSADRPAPAAVGGYEFSWQKQRVLIARPVRAGETGVRWFATADGALIYEFDPALFKSGSSGPPTRSMVEYLSMRENLRTESTRPPGWKRLN